MKKLKIVIVDPKYCDFLRSFDTKVYYNDQEKRTRPFIGVLFEMSECEYFAPLTSPKPKHIKMKNTIDFYKIDAGKLGAINFNNMIPLAHGSYQEIDLNKKGKLKEEKQYYQLLREQLYWLNAHIWQIEGKSLKLYKLYVTENLNKSIKKRCCNFVLLEKVCKKWKNK